MPVRGQTGSNNEKRNSALMKVAQSIPEKDVASSLDDFIAKANAALDAGDGWGLTTSDDDSAEMARAEADRAQAEARAAHAEARAAHAEADAQARLLDAQRQLAEAEARAAAAEQRAQRISARIAVPPVPQSAPMAQATPAPQRIARASAPPPMPEPTPEPVAAPIAAPPVATAPAVAIDVDPSIPDPTFGASLAEPRKKSPALLIALLSVALGGAGVFAALKLLGGDSSEKKNAAEAAPAAAPAPADTPVAQPLPDPIAQPLDGESEPAAEADEQTEDSEDPEVMALDPEDIAALEEPEPEPEVEDEPKRAERSAADSDRPAKTSAKRSKKKSSKKRSKRRSRKSAGEKKSSGGIVDPFAQ